MGQGAPVEGDRHRRRRDPRHRGHPVDHSTRGCRRSRTRETQFDEYQTSADSALGMKDEARDEAIKDALSHLDGLVREYPDSDVAPRALLRAAELLTATGQPAKAAGYFERLTEMSGAPEGMKTLARRGWAASLEQSGDVEKAIVEYKALADASTAAGSRRSGLGHRAMLRAPQGPGEREGRSTRRPSSRAATARGRNWPASASKASSAARRRRRASRPRRPPRSPRRRRRGCGAGRDCLRSGHDRLRAGRDASAAGGDRFNAGGHAVHAGADDRPRRAATAPGCRRRTLRRNRIRATQESHVHTANQNTISEKRRPGGHFPSRPHARIRAGASAGPICLCGCPKASIRGRACPSLRRWAWASKGLTR